MKTKPAKKKTKRTPEATLIETLAVAISRNPHPVSTAYTSMGPVKTGLASLADTPRYLLRKMAEADPDSFRTLFEKMQVVAREAEN